MQKLAAISKSILSNINTRAKFTAPNATDFLKKRTANNQRAYRIGATVGGGINSVVKKSGNLLKRLKVGVTAGVNKYKELSK